VLVFNSIFEDVGDDSGEDVGDDSGEDVGDDSGEDVGDDSGDGNKGYDGGNIKDPEEISGVDGGVYACGS